MCWPVARYCFFFACTSFCLFICSLCTLLPYLVNKDVYIYNPLFTYAAYNHRYLCGSGLDGHGDGGGLGCGVAAAVAAAAAAVAGVA